MVVIAAIIIGLFGGTFSVAMMNGMVQRRIVSVVHQEAAHIQLHHSEFQANKDPEHTISSPQALLNDIAAEPEVKAVSKRLITLGMASTARKNRGVNIISIQPEQEKKVSSVHQLLLDSTNTYFEGRTRMPILIGKQFAEKMNLKLRSKVLLTLQGEDGYQTGGSFRVVGIFKTDNSTFNEANVFVRQKDLSAIAGFSTESAHEIAILLHTIEQTDAFKTKMEEKYATLKVDSFKTLSPDVAILAEYMDFYLLFFIGIILLALGFGIVNTMLMVVLERVKEFGMLMAIGMTKARVFTMILLETVYLVFFGGVIGMTISHFLTVYYGKVGIDLSSYAEGFEALGYSSVLRPSIDFSNYLNISMLILLTGVIASIYPAIKAIKLKPAEAIRTI